MNRQSLKQNTNRLFLEKGETYFIGEMRYRPKLGLDSYTLLYYTYGGIMTITNETNRDFKLWMVATLGLIKDGKMGASQARADRIKTAMTYTKRGGKQ